MAVNCPEALLSIQDIIAFSNNELAQFMQRHPCPDFSFDGWDKLSTDEKDEIAQRLNAREQALDQNPATRSQQPGRNWLNARVHEVWPGHSLPPQGLFDVVTKEVKAHRDLVRDGGRPLYPVDLLKHVSREPGEYLELLRPWQNPPDSRRVWEVFQRQRQKWQAFRTWQQENRGIEDSFPAYVKSFMQWAKAHMNAEGIAAVSDPSYLQERWAYRQRKRQRFRVYGGLGDYERAMRQRLARHGFDRSFKLRGDPKEQDELTTWIEYLNFECWWLDRLTTDKRHWQGANQDSPEDVHLGDSGGTMKRHDLITHLIQRRFAQEDATRQAGLISWVLEQATLIEAEQGCALVVRDCIIVAMGPRKHGETAGILGRKQNGKRRAWNRSNGRKGQLRGGVRRRGTR